jgi:hypothetical protein
MPRVAMKRIAIGGLHTKTDERWLIVHARYPSSEVSTDGRKGESDDEDHTERLAVLDEGPQ